MRSPNLAVIFQSQLAELINGRGYLVVGAEGSYRPGDRVAALDDAPSDQPLVLIAETTRADHEEQCRIGGPFVDTEARDA
jgi:hypothetical protein